ncbi:ROK family protein [Geothrix sp. PMB-07]|uniref:ROK family protein n=1 Tax=Geothrix sp. PMB-07 TaxID=3068640 RepID=UPI00274156E7|nr:ROK family protein [Geothrix sp. PMB-07]WLT31892.1 ROK family protein [Geothrix sp. PMB-07]
MSLTQDSRMVLTLDAGGTNLVFGAMKGGEELLEPLSLPTHGEDLTRCLATITEGFEQSRSRLDGPAAAISFAFPGPSDYPAGIIGDLANLPAFRGGVPLGPLLEDHFGIPVFINNDGDLFAYGEAMAGLLPEVNLALEEVGSPKRYRNLLGVTLGTGFGGGLVQGGRLYRGDNGAGAEIWSMRNKLDPGATAEEGISIRAVRRAYAEGAGLSLEACPEPAAIHRIARGEGKGDQAAAIEAFRRLGEVLGDALANATTLVDALVVVGGGLSGAADLILPAAVREMNSELRCAAATFGPRLESAAFNLEDATGRTAFLRGESRLLTVPGSGRQVPYDPLKRVGVGLSRLGTSRATALGAYAFALTELDRITSGHRDVANLA